MCEFLSCLTSASISLHRGVSRRPDCPMVSLCTIGVDGQDMQMAPDLAPLADDLQRLSRSKMPCMYPIPPVSSVTVVVRGMRRGCSPPSSTCTAVSPLANPRNVGSRCMTCHGCRQNSRPAEYLLGLISNMKAGYSSATRSGVAPTPSRQPCP